MRLNILYENNALLAIDKPSGILVIPDRWQKEKGRTLIDAIQKRYKQKKTAESPLIARLALHAASLEFEHPESGRLMKIASPLPKPLKTAKKMLEKHGGS